MQEAKKATASWPEKFVYVCTAGRGSNVNAAPMLHAIGKVVGLVTLVPVTDRGAPSAADRAEAIYPANRHESYARSSLLLSPDAILRFYGHPDLIADWTGAMEMATKLASRLDAEIVFNITGGRKPATLGAILGIGSAGDVPVSLLSIGAAGFTARLVQISGGKVVERPLPLPAAATMDQYLATYGFQEIDRAKREEWVAWCENQAALVKALDGLSSKTLRAVFSTINKKTAAVFAPTMPSRIDLGNSAIAFQSIVNHLNYTTIEGNVITVTDPDEYRFLRGGWLEAVVHLRAKDALRGINGLSMVSGIFVGQLGGQKAETEFDLAILSDDRLDLIEVKAVMDARGLQAAITKLEHYRKLLAGPQGRAWLVLPLMFTHTAKIAEITDRAAAEGITLLLGDGAVSRLMSDLAQRHRARI